MNKDELRKLIKDFLDNYEGSDFPESDIEYLFENLSVFRKELEFQNDELKRINIELENKNAFIENIFRIIPSIVLIIDEEYHVIKGNAEFYKKFPYADTNHIDFRRLFIEESQSNLYFLINKKTPRTNLYGVNGRIYLADISDCILTDQKFILLHLTDITEIEENKAKIHLENELKSLFSEVHELEVDILSDQKYYEHILQKIIDGIERILSVEKIYYFESNTESGYLKISSKNNPGDVHLPPSLDESVFKLLNDQYTKGKSHRKTPGNLISVEKKISQSGYASHRIHLSINKKSSGLLLIISKKPLNGHISNLLDTELPILISKIKSQINLAQNELELHVIIDNSPDGIAVIENGKLLFANDNYFKITGVSKDDDRWKDLPKIFEYIHPDEREYVKQIFINAIKKREKFISYEFRILDAKGQYIWQQDNVNILYFNPDGYRLYINSRNISDQKERINRLITLEEAINQSDASIIITDLNGNIQFVNKSFTDITGYSKEEVLNKNTNILKSGILSQEVYKQLWDDITSGKSWHGELINKKKDGSLFTESVTIYPVVIQGKITNFVAVKKDITKLKELQKKYETLSLVASHTQNMVIITDNKGYITWVNKSFEQKTGYTFEEVLGKKPGPILQGKDTSDIHVSIIRKKLAELKPFKQEILNYTKSGIPYWIEMSIAPVFDHQGNHIMYIAVEDDITIKKEYEQKILENERKNRAILNAIPDLILIIDKDLKIVDHYSGNPSKMFIFQENILGKSIENILPEEQRNTFRKNISHIFRTAEFREFLFDLEISGKKKYFEARCVLKDIYSVLILIRDITKTILYDQQLNNERLLFKTVIDNLPNTIYVKDKQFRKILVNKAEVYNLGKVSEAEVLGKTDDEFYEAEVIKGIREEDADVMAGNPLINKVIEYTNNWGEKKFLMISKLPYRDIDGQIIGIIGIGVDITSLKLKEEELRKTIGIITNQNERLRSFTYIVSHNIRSYASNIEGLIQLINNKLVDESEKEEIFKHLQKASENLMETITSLNSVITLEKKAADSLEKINVNKVLEKVLNVVNRDIADHQILIINEIPEDATILFNASFFESILLNLTTNAIRYRSKERNSFIKYSWKEKGAYKILEVTDNGLGIDLEKYGKKLFNMFETFHGNPDAKGLGLYITKAQVESMGGKIEVESTVNLGSTFRIFLKK